MTATASHWDNTTPSTVGIGPPRLTAASSAVRPTNFINQQSPRPHTTHRGLVKNERTNDLWVVHGFGGWPHRGVRCSTERMKNRVAGDSLNAPDHTHQQNVSRRRGLCAWVYARGPDAVMLVSGCSPGTIRRTVGTSTTTSRSTDTHTTRKVVTIPLLPPNSGFRDKRITQADGLLSCKRKVAIFTDGQLMCCTLWRHAASFTHLSSEVRMRYTRYYRAQTLMLYCICVVSHEFMTTKVLSDEQRKISDNITIID
jgi:hypothetical protein